MSDYAVGRGKPPKHSQFRKGRSGNPRGRPKREGDELGKIIEKIAKGTVEYLDGGRLRMATRHELNIKALVNQALAGEVPAAAMLLKLRELHQQGSDGGVERIGLRKWLPDYRGQTSNQKTAAQVKRGGIPSGRRRQTDGGPNS
jgi:hypothetical protein